MKRANPFGRSSISPRRNVLFLKGQQLALARQLDLHPSQVDVWFQIKKSGSLEKEIQKRMDCRDDICIDVDAPIDEADMIEAFKYFDRNGDGKITGQNLLESFKTLGEENRTLEECQSMIAALDKNGNGFMSFEDFSHMLLMEDN
ncbi:probable calcium-binding protein CML36 [Mercurialis annua]|uniref:probable calcium-binding protein CML36 n=1 Tax=Mercurialis annua TaxID=3986 RepID=UPI002160D0A0|nr:probable calcium-binding protein CML36 [Mercurialis annua]